MMKKTIKLWTAAVLAAAVLLVATAIATPEKAYEVSLDTGLDVLSVYICYEPKDAFSELTVRFPSELSGYGYSNFKDGKLWISIAVAEPIDCTKPLAYVTATDSDGSTVVPEMTMTLLKINGKKISDTEVKLESASAYREGEVISVSAEVKDELIRPGVTIYAAAYDGDGKMIAVAKRAAEPEGGLTEYSLTLEDTKDATSVKVMLLSDALAPYTEPFVTDEITEG